MQGVGLDISLVQTTRVTCGDVVMTQGDAIVSGGTNGKSGDMIGLFTGSEPPSVKVSGKYLCRFGVLC